MKKILFSLIALICFAATSSAQLISAASDHSGVKFGIRGSFALSKLSQGLNSDLNLGVGNVSLKDHSLPTFAAGCALDIPVLESFHFNIELKYAMKGQKSMATVNVLGNEAMKIESFTRIGYVEVPVQPQFRLLFNNSNLNFNVGPYFALGLHGQNKVTTTTGNETTSQKTLLYTGRTITSKNGDSDSHKSDPNYKAPVSRFDMGMALNVAYEIEFLHIGVGYEIGTRDIRKDGKDLRDLAESLGNNYTPLKNRTFYATIGVNF